MINYRDFWVTIGPAYKGVYPVSIDSPAGKAMSTLSLPFTDDATFEQTLGRLGSKVLDGRALYDLDYDEEPAEEVDPQQFGELLFTSMFHGKALSLLRDSLREHSTESTGLRIKLHLDVEDASLRKLNQVPWELLKDPNQRDFLNLSQRTPVVRYLEFPKNPNVLKFSPPFRVLVVISNPSNFAELDLEREREIIKQSWGKRSDVQVDFLSQATKQALQTQLSHGQYHGLHFMGHGEFDRKSGRGTLVMEKEDGTADLISGEALGVLLRDEPTLRFVVLNACKTAQSDASSRQDAFSSVAPALLLTGIPAVVAMQYPISDKAAIAFSETFYRLLPACHPLEMVVAEARKRVEVLQESLGKHEWATPVLFMRTPDGRIFESIYRNEPLGNKQQQQLSKLTAKVRQFWIEGKLDEDIPIKPPIELTKELWPKAVVNSFEDVVEIDDEEQLVPAGKTIAHIYDEYDRSLLILGDPGYGKSITLLALAQHLIRRHDADPAEPVPVVLFLAGWTTSDLKIEDWIVREVSEKYKLPASLIREWLVSDRIVLMLDGLDELPQEKRKACVHSINEFMKEQLDADGRCCLAVCSRFAEYEELSVQFQARFDFEGAIRLCPLNETQIRDFLDKCGPKMKGFQNFLEQDPQLLVEAHSPLWLGMMSITYMLAPAEFDDLATNESVDDFDEQTRHELLISTYIDRIFRRKGKREARYSREQTLDGLSWLATHMKDHHQNLFLIEGLQPTWLSSLRQHLVYLGLFSVAVGLVFALVLGGVWYASDLINPSHPISMKSQRYWWLVVPLWIFCIGLLDLWRGTFRRPHFDDRWKQITYKISLTISRAAVFYAVWAVLWIVVALLLGVEWGNISIEKDAFIRIEGNDAWKKTSNSITANTFLLWISHPLQCGLTAALMYAMRVGLRDSEHYIGTSEQLKFTTDKTLLGLSIGLAAGFVAWLAFITFTGEWSNLKVGAENLYFYLPVGAAAGLLFGSLRMGSVETKTRPNEGIILSLRNCLYGAAIIGPALGLAMMPILANAFPWIDPSERQWACFVLAVILGLAAMLWYGLIDVIRHYILRLTLYLFGHTPICLASFYDHMADLILLQKIGGGYIFRNHLLFDYFSRKEE